MSFPKRHRWFSRIAFGLAVTSVVVAGRASAMIDPGTHGSQHVTAGGWSGQVDLESGIPLSAGIPHGDEQFIDEQSVEVIPYLSHGILTQAQADATAAPADDDHSVTDIFVRPGESLGGPDGGPVVSRSARGSHGIRAAADAQAKDDPYLTDINVRPGESLGGPDGGPLVTRGARSEGTLADSDAQTEDGQTERVWTDRD